MTIRSWRDGWRSIGDERDDPEGAEEDGQHRGHFQLRSQQQEQKQKLVTILTGLQVHRKNILPQVVILSLVSALDH